MKKERWIDLIPEHLWLDLSDEMKKKLIGIQTSQQLYVIKVDRWIENGD